MAMSAHNIKSGFEKTGLHPLNRDILRDEAFAPAAALQRTSRSAEQGIGQQSGGVPADEDEEDMPELAADLDKDEDIVDGGGREDEEAAARAEEGGEVVFAADTEDELDVAKLLLEVRENLVAMEAAASSDSPDSDNSSQQARKDNQEPQLGRNQPSRPTLTQTRPLTSVGEMEAGMGLDQVQSVVLTLPRAEEQPRRRITVNMLVNATRQLTNPMLLECKKQLEEAAEQRKRAAEQKKEEAERRAREKEELEEEKRRKREAAEEKRREKARLDAEKKKKQEEERKAREERLQKEAEEKERRRIELQKKKAEKERMDKERALRKQEQGKRKAEQEASGSGKSLTKRRRTGATPAQKSTANHMQSATPLGGGEGNPGVDGVNWLDEFLQPIAERQHPELQQKNQQHASTVANNAAQFMSQLMGEGSDDDLTDSEV
jgi:hypothetical protein